VGFMVGKWHWDTFSPSTFVSPANCSSIPFNYIVLMMISSLMAKEKTKEKRLKYGYMACTCILLGEMIN
jgi:hypothetical protein